MKKGILLIGVLGIFITLLLCGCQKTYSYDFKELCEISVSGCDGKGSVSIKMDHDKEGFIVHQSLGENADDLSSARLTMALELIQFEIEPNEDLSNGDSVNITVDYDAKYFKDNGIKFNNSQFSYTVSGLQEVQTIDLFSDLSYSFDGISPDARINVSTSQCNDVIKNNVRFSADKSYGIKNGDVITVTASYNKDALSEKGYLAETDTVQITASGLDEYILDISGYSTNELDDALKTKAEDVVANSTYKVGTNTYSAKLIKDGNLSEKWCINSIEMVPTKIDFLIGDNQRYNNIYVIFWELDVNATKSYTSKYVTKPDGYAVGDTDTFTIYLETHYSNLISLSGEMSLEKASTGYTTYGTSLAGDYVGSTLDEVYSAFMTSIGDYAVKNKIL